MIAVECFPDEVLLRVLGVPASRIIHSKGKGNVLNALCDGRAFVGMVDEDPGSIQPAKLNAHFVAGETFGSLRLLRHRSDARRTLVVLSPRLEEWFLGRAAACKLDPATFHLPTTAKALKQKRFDTMPGYRRMIEALLASDGEVRKLQAWASSAASRN